MVTKDNGGPAFPVPAELCQDLTVEEQRGLTLRDWFAGKAMQGLQANPVEGVCEMGFEEIAKYAYAQADAMLKAREA